MMLVIPEQLMSCRRLGANPKMQLRGWSLLLAIAFAIGGSLSYGVAQESKAPPQDAIPIEIPRPSYPPMAAFFGMIGYCEVVFAVDERGYAFNLYTSCTDYVFCFQSKKAVNEALFTPAYEYGRPRVRANVVYPFEYLLEGDTPDMIDRSGLKPCRKRAVS